MRFAVEERLRGQMDAAGSPTQKMLPYNSNVSVKRKRWHNRRDLMPRPFVEAKLLCPSPDMTNGWLVFTTKAMATWLAANWHPQRSNEDRPNGVRGGRTVKGHWPQESRTSQGE